MKKDYVSYKICNKKVKYFIHKGERKQYVVVKDVYFTTNSPAMYFSINSHFKTKNTSEAIRPCLCSYLSGDPHSRRDLLRSFPAGPHGRKLFIKSSSQEVLALFVPHTAKLFSSRVLRATDGCNQHETTALLLYQFTNAQPSFLVHFIPAFIFLWQTK